MSDADWVEAALVEPGMVQRGCGIAERDRIVGTVVDGADVIVAYADETTMAYPAHRELPILRQEG